jgi:hypothetical protein
MQHTTFVQEIRDFVQQSFRQHGIGLVDMRETILIREGCYCGRRFESNDGYAVWFCEENQLKIYNAHGILVEVVNQLQERCHTRITAQAA